MNKPTTHHNYYTPIRPSTGDPPPDTHRFAGAVQAANAWAKKHPNPIHYKSKKPPTK